MTVAEMACALNLEEIAAGDTQREVTGGYAGDLLSWVMGRAQAGDAWVTIMSNANIVAVATLADTAAVILAEGVTLEPEVAELARTKGINVYSGAQDTFTLCGKIAALL